MPLGLTKTFENRLPRTDPKSGVLRVVSWVPRVFAEAWESSCFGVTFLQVGGAPGKCSPPPMHGEVGFQRKGLTLALVAPGQRQGPHVF